MLINVLGFSIKGTALVPAEALWSGVQRLGTRNFRRKEREAFCTENADPVQGLLLTTKSNRRRVETDRNTGAVNIASTPPDRDLHDFTFWTAREIGNGTWRGVMTAYQGAPWLSTMEHYFTVIHQELQGNAIEAQYPDASPAVRATLLTHDGSLVFEPLISLHDWSGVLATAAKFHTLYLPVQVVEAQDPKQLVRTVAMATREVLTFSTREGNVSAIRQALTAYLSKPEQSQGAALRATLKDGITATLYGGGTDATGYGSEDHDVVLASMLPGIWKDYASCGVFPWLQRCMQRAPQTFGLPT